MKQEKMRWVAAIAALAAATVVVSPEPLQAQDKKAALHAGDRMFVMEAAQGGIMEVQVGRVASVRASNSQVKQFGQRMVTDHSKANSELEQIARSKGITLPKDAGKHKGHIAQLARLSGAAFDRAYMKHMVEDHKKDVAAFRKEASSGKDPAVKAFAAKTLPTLQQHLRLATTVNAAVKKSGKATASSR